MKELVNLLQTNNLTITACESLTGGLFSSRLVSISGSSKVFKGSLVTYANEMKTKLANVDSELIAKHGVISYEVANEMAKNVAKICESDIGVSFSGNAGPEVMENKTAGLVYSSVYYRGKCWSYEDLLEGSRNEIREKIIDLMIERVKEILKV